MAANKSDKTTTYSAGPHKAKSAANSLLTSLAVIVSLIGINFIATRVFGRVDLTEDHVYKLSNVSIETVRSLPDRMNVKAFISGTLPAQMMPTANYVRDLLEEYKVASKGKLDWEAIDPTEGKDQEEKNKKKEELTKYKI